MTAQPPDPWLQREGETDKAYQGFLAYMNIGPGRSLAAAYRSYSGRPPEDVRTEAPTWFRDWSRQYGWPQRASAWDARVRAEERDRELAAAAKEAEDRRKVRLGAYRAMIGAGQVIMSKAKLGQIGDRQARALLSHAARMIDTGSRGERLELGEPDSIQRSEIVGGGPNANPVRVDVGAASLSVDDIAANLTQVLAELPPEERTAALNKMETYIGLQKELAPILSAVERAVRGEPEIS